VVAIAHNLDRRGLPDRELTDRHDEFVRVGDRAVADLDDYVSLQNPALLRGTACLDVGPQGTRGYRIAHRPGVHPQRRVVDLAVPDQYLGDRVSPG
jgi:hypothetical protein